MISPVCWIRRTTEEKQKKNRRKTEEKQKKNRREDTESSQINAGLALTKKKMRVILRLEQMAERRSQAAVR
jgi:hypothetical protein